MTLRATSWVLCLAAMAGLACDAIDLSSGMLPDRAPAAAGGTLAPKAVSPTARASVPRELGRALPHDGAAAAHAARRLPRLADGLATLFDGTGAPLGAAQAARAAAQRGIRLADERVQVVAHLASPLRAERGDSVTLGGAPFAVDAASGVRVQGWVRLADLPRVSGDPAVRAVTVPVMPRTTAVTSEGVAKMNVPVVHALGIQGQGQKVAVLDVGFQGYAALRGTELPASVVTKSYYGAAPGDITGGGEVHGTAVAEVVHDIAPQAQIYLVNYDSEVTFQAAVDWLVAQGVDVITTSTGTYSWEDTDGTGPVAASANAARDAGIVFTAAAGNSGDSHHRATFTPSAVAEFHRFYAGGGNILFLADDGTNLYGIPDGAPLLVDLVWDDWGLNNGTPSSTVDYDLYLALFDETIDPGTGQPVGWGIVAASEDVQGGAAFPRESIGVYTPTTPSGSAVYGLVVAKKAAAAANVPFDLYITNVFADLPFFGPDILTPAQSVITPCVGAKVQCIGAVDVNDGLLAYSSRGPSHPDGTGATVPKPDFAAPSEVLTATYPEGFGGTSGATPHAAGVAALFLQQAGGDAAVAEAQMRAAAVDLGAAGRDDTYGHGRVRAVPCWPALCDDGLACTTDTCHATLGCQHAASGTGCFIAGACVAHDAPNPSNACQKCDQAAPAQWSGVTDGTACAADTNDCTLDQCQAGACAHPTAPNNTPCADDGRACTSDLCQAGACAHAVTIGCLIADTCYAAGAPNPDNPCQQCAPANKTQWTNRADTSPCEDGLFCTSGDACQAGLCQSGLPRDCSALADDCNTVTCNEDVDACAKVPKADLQPCAGDGDNCTLDRCEGGICTHPALANDCGGRVCGTSPNGCHACGNCPEGFGCGSDGMCSDLCAGVNCPECQACQGGACVPSGEGAACTADANECTRDVCASGTCAHPAVANGLPCDDGTACTRSDTCQAGTCTGASPVVCGALDGCHDAGSCNPADGTCSDPAKPDGTPCGDDGNACTRDACTAGACLHPVVDDGAACDDGDACTHQDGCVAGTCTGADPVACPAPAECRSQGACNPATGQCSDPAEADGVPCGDDGNACTSDACQAGACLHPARTDGTACADEGLSCTKDACTGGTCTHVREAGCLIDGSCVAAGEVHPLNPCQACLETAPTAWSVVADGTACDDGAFCTLDETCQDGLCTAGGQRDCSAGDGACTEGTCSESEDACEATPRADGAACGDTYDCSAGVLTRADSCRGGRCVDAGTVDCAPYAGCAAEGACRTTCGTAADCLSGNRCVAGACGANRAPVADAGLDLAVDEGDEVILDGTGSSDADGDLLAFAWTQEGDPAVSLDDAAVAQPSFTAPEVDAETVLVFRLMAKDGLLSSPYDEVRVTIRDVPKPPEGEDAVPPPEGEDAQGPADTAAEDAAGSDDSPPADVPVTADTPADGTDTAHADGGRLDVPLVEVPGDTGGTDTGPAKKGGGCTAGGATPVTLAPLLLALAAFAARRRRGSSVASKP